MRLARHPQRDLHAGPAGGPQGGGAFSQVPFGQIGKN
jgi:hypothetical protein